jgi:hypothetical protein
MRVLFTVALLVAVAGVVLPAVDAAGLDRAESQSRGAVERLVDAGRSLAAGNDALQRPEAAARRSVTVSLPNDGIGSAPLERLTVRPPETATGESDGPGPAATRIAWRVAGGQRHVTQVDGLRIRASDDGRFQIREGGRHTLVLRLLERDGERVVTVTPVDT